MKSKAWTMPFMAKELLKSINHGESGEAALYQIV